MKEMRLLRSVLCVFVSSILARVFTFRYMFDASAGAGGAATQENVNEEDLFLHLPPSVLSLFFIAARVQQPLPSFSVYAYELRFFYSHGRFERTRLGPGWSWYNDVLMAEESSTSDVGEYGLPGREGKRRQESEESKLIVG